MGAEGKFDLKLAPGYDPESAVSSKPVSSTVAGTPPSWSSLVKNNCPDKAPPPSSSSCTVAGGVTGSCSRKGSSSSVCSVASSSDVSLTCAKTERRAEEHVSDLHHDPILVLSSNPISSGPSTCPTGGETVGEGGERKTGDAPAISMGIVSISSPDVSSVSELSNKEAAVPRPLGSSASNRLSVSSLLAAGAPMSSSASVPNLSSRETSSLESFVRRVANIARTNATNNMNLSRSSSDNNTNTLGRNAVSSASEY